MFTVNCVDSLLIHLLIFCPDTLMSCSVGACASASTTWPTQSRVSTASVWLVSIATRGSSTPRCPRWSLTLLWSGWTEMFHPLMRSRLPAFPQWKKCYLGARSATPVAGEMRLVLHMKSTFACLYSSYSEYYDRTLAWKLARGWFVTAPISLKTQWVHIISPYMVKVQIR